MQPEPGLPNNFDDRQPARPAEYLPPSTSHPTQPAAYVHHQTSYIPFLTALLVPHEANSYLCVAVLHVPYCTFSGV